MMSTLYEQQQREAKNIQDLSDFHEQNGGSCLLLAMLDMRQQQTHKPMPSLHAALLVNKKLESTQGLNIAANRVEPDFIPKLQRCAPAFGLELTRAVVDDNFPIPPERNDQLITVVQGKSRITTQGDSAIIIFSHAASPAGHAEFISEDNLDQLNLLLGLGYHPRAVLEFNKYTTK